MVKKKSKILWDIEAKKLLLSIYNYIKYRESQGQAQRAKKRILKEVRNLILFPEKFSVEPHLQSEKGNYRFRAIWSYKIIYEITPEAILVLDIFHTSRNPQSITKLSED
ncbi:MAG: type II toxin-antitoxin system RelE/ParE family toxin [Cyclobacteriaceae bacterium]|nr:type II toxin-antitoxin system RelE/ParE family toxin [Cyclobacteriaceae bacterium]